MDGIVKLKEIQDIQSEADYSSSLLTKTLYRTKILLKKMTYIL